MANSLSHVQTAESIEAYDQFSYYLNLPSKQSEDDVRW